MTTVIESSNELNESDNSLLLRQQPIERAIQSNGSSNTVTSSSNRPSLATSGGGSSRNFLSRLGINTNTTNNNTNSSEIRGSNNSDSVNLRSSNFTDDGHHHNHPNTNNHHSTNDNLISATLVEDTNVILTQVVTDNTNTLKPPESEVEEILSSGTGTEQYNRVNSTLTNEDEDSVPPDYSHFRIPRNTYAIAIDDSTDFAGISSDFQTIVGDGYDEIMGFEDFVVNFMENHTDDYVFLIADENENDQPMTVSGSQCVEKIRNRLSPRLERRMFSLIRSANDSSSDINIYRSRAHGFLPKAPIKRDTVVEMLAPLWLDRFPPSEFGESMGLSSSNKGNLPGIASDDIACTPFDIAKKVEISSLYLRVIYISQQHIRFMIKCTNSRVTFSHLTRSSV